jgi:outer membrane autotransporter protein
LRVYVRVQLPSLGHSNAYSSRCQTAGENGSLPNRYRLARRCGRTAIAAIVLIAVSLFSPVLAQTTIVVNAGVDPGTTSSGLTQAGTLSAAIAEVNASGGSGPPYTIQIAGNITLTGPLSPILNSVTIVGNGNTITANNTRIFMVGVDTATQTSAQGNPPTSSSIISQRQQVSISNLALSSGVAQGGTGGAGAGGGLGAGGALFVNQSADVTLTAVSFANNRAIGGSGGTGFGGGGGGIGGAGASIPQNGNGGGGIFGSASTAGGFGGGGLLGNGGSKGGGGYSGDGGSGPNNAGGSGNLSISGLAGSGGNAQTIVGGANGGGGASRLGGGGGGFGGGGTQQGFAGGAGGFGGGGGSGDAANGGAGGFGGGGGGAFPIKTCTGEGCTPLPFGNGGQGGFGGGGGGGGAAAGNGGFGGGGGAGLPNYPGLGQVGAGGSGGFGAGGGGTAAGGFGGGTGIGQTGGGAGMGGAVFVVTGGTLTINGDGATSGGSVAGAAGGNVAQTFGSGFFMQGSVLNFGTGNYFVSDVIADQTGSGGGSASNGVGGVGGVSTIVKSGSGTTTLGAANTYTGGTVLNAGTVSVSADNNLGSPVGSITFNGGVLQVTGTSFTSTSRVINWAANGGGFDIADPVNAFSVAQTLSGGGPLSKLGPGTLVLLGSDNYSGGTTIAGGVLQLGNGGTSGSITGNVVDNGVLAIKHSDAVAFPGIISGNGGVAQIGTGTTFLTGVNSYSGGTLVASGTLVGNATSFGSGPMLDNATLIFDQSTNASFSNAISGGGQLIKQGAGALNLTGASSLSGPTTIVAGLLSVNGTLAPSVVTVDNGATLGGNGTVGGILANSGATVAPGNNSIGTLHAAAPGGGNIAFVPGSFFSVELNSSGQNAQIQATGKASITGGTVQILPAQGLYTPSLIYTLITASGGVYGIGGVQAPSSQRIQSTQFFSGLSIDSSGTNFAFLQPMLTYDANDVYLEFKQVHSFPSDAITPNQRSTAGGVQDLGSGNPIFDVVIGQSVAGARQAFDVLSGEIHASAVTAAFEDSRLPREAILDHLSQADCPVGTASCYCDHDQRRISTEPIVRKAVEQIPTKARHCEPKWFDMWMQAFGDWGHINTDHNAAAMGRSLDGFIVGADARLAETSLGTWRIGVAGGHTGDSISVFDRLSSGNVQTDFAALYGGASLGALQLRTGAIYGLNSVATSRQIIFPGFADSASSKYGGSIAQAFGELGYRFGFAAFRMPGFDFSRAMIEPFMGAAAIHVHEDGFTETGGLAALTGLAQGYDFATTTVGLRADATFAASWPLTARGLLGWRHGYGAAAPLTLMSFQNSPSPFAIAGLPIGRDAFVVEAGLDYAATANLTLGVAYSGQYSQLASDNAFKAYVDLRF